MLNNLIAKDLAVDLVDLYHGLDPFEFTYREDLDGVIDTYNDLLNGDIMKYIVSLKDLKEEGVYVVAENGSLIELDIQGLIDRLNDLKNEISL